MLWSFSGILICIKNQSLKKWENENYLNLLLNRPISIRNGITIPILLITTFFNSHSPKGVSFSSKSMNMGALVKVLILTTRTFRAWSLSKIFNFFKAKYFILGNSKKNQTYISDSLTLFGCILRIKFLKMTKIG